MEQMEVKKMKKAISISIANKLNSKQRPDMAAKIVKIQVLMERNFNIACCNFAINVIGII